MSQKELGDILGFTSQTISNYEAEKTEVDYKTIKKISEIFEVDIDYILGNKAEYLLIDKDKFFKLSEANKIVSEIIEEIKNKQIEKKETVNSTQISASEKGVVQIINKSPNSSNNIYKNSKEPKK